MYTKEDVGTKVYLPWYGDKPLVIKNVNDHQFYPVLVIINDDLTLCFCRDGRSEMDDLLPVLSRTPYIPGEPFRCVTEKPLRTIQEVKASDTLPTEHEWKLLREEWEEKATAGPTISTPLFTSDDIAKPFAIDEEGNEYVLFMKMPGGFLAMRKHQWGCYVTIGENGLPITGPYNGPRPKKLTRLNPTNNA